jgi:RNA polymerase sigma-70 factor (ECF subfamily)
MDDTQHLLESASRGDAMAIDELLARYLPGLRAFIRLRAGALLRGKESSSDLAQSACREVLQHLDNFRYQSERGFKQWLFTTALRKIQDRRDFYLAAKRDAGREEGAGGGASDDGDARLLECYRAFSSPSHHAIAREELERIERAFEELPEDYREVIVLARVVGLPHADIAAQMSRNEGAVRVLLSRALASLARLTRDPSAGAT